MYGLRKERPLTEKGKMMFDSKCSTQQRNCDTSWNRVEDLIISLQECNDVKSLRKLHCDINQACHTYCKYAEEYKLYLKREGTAEASAALETFSPHFDKCLEVVNKCLTDLRNKKLELIETISQSGASVQSGTSSSKRTKAAVEQAKLEYVRQEGELLKQKAEIEANISIVKQKAVAAAANIEATYDEDKVEEPRIPVSDKMQDVQNFVDESRRFTLQPDSNQTFPLYMYAPVASANVNTPPNPVNAFDDMGEPLPNLPVSSPVIMPPRNVNFSAHINQPPPPEYLPYGSQGNIPPTSVSAPVPQNLPETRRTQQSLYSAVTQNQSLMSVTSDITRYMLRKDFLLTRFANFDDKPETYPSWRVSFQSIIRELQVTPFEEMDLLVKWLGPKSSQFAKSIRSANAHDSPRGVTRIWERLQEGFGRPEMIEFSIKSKIAAFPNMAKDYTKLYDLLDILTEIESVMEHPEYTTLLSYFNSSTGVSPIVKKLPYSIQDKWVFHASRYKKRYSVAFPPFPVFVAFIREMCEIRNDPAFSNFVQSSPAPVKQMPAVFARRVDVKSDSKVETRDNSDNMERCPVHKSTGHDLNHCKAFKRKPIPDRKKFLKDKGICFRCCLSNSHFAKDCEVTLKCHYCGSSNHATALHINKPRQQNEESDSDDKEPSRIESNDNSNSPSEETVITRCSAVCGDMLLGRSCGKTVLVDVYSENAPDNVVRVFAPIDDQSNQTLGTPDLFDQLGISGQVTTVVMSTCSGSVSMAGRQTTQLCVRSADGTTVVKLPRTIECDSIPCEYPEIATPDVAQQHSHLNGIANYLPRLYPDVKVMLLIGRDLPEVYHVQEQTLGNDKSGPFAQKLSLGWVVIGDVCLGRVHAPKTVNVRRTNILETGQSTTFPFCANRIEIKEQNDDLFIRTPSDNKVGQSVEDKQFLRIMDSEFHLDDSGHWSVPLPFKETKEQLSNNHSQAWKRAQILDASLRKNATKQEHFMTFMDKVISSGAAEEAPTEATGEC